MPNTFSALLAPGLDARLRPPPLPRLVVVPSLVALSIAARSTLARRLRARLLLHLRYFC